VACNIIRVRTSVLAKTLADRAAGELYFTGEVTEFGFYLGLQSKVSPGSRK
jgi:hypothetical protein